MSVNINTIRHLRPLTDKEKSNVAWWDEHRPSEWPCQQKINDAADMMLDIQSDAGPDFNVCPDVRDALDKIQHEVDEMLYFIGYKIEDWATDGY